MASLGMPRSTDLLADSKIMTLYWIQVHLGINRQIHRSEHGSIRNAKNIGKIYARKTRKTLHKGNILDKKNMTSIQRQTCTKVQNQEFWNGCHKKLVEDALSPWGCSVIWKSDSSQRKEKRSHPNNK